MSRFRRPKVATSPLFEDASKGSDVSMAVIQLARKSGQLNLSGRGLPQLPQIVCGLNSLTEEEVKSIDVSLDRGGTDDTWWEQQPLSKLFLGSNKLDTLPKEIAQLEFLTILELQDNNISAFPQEMEGLFNLVRLNVGHNKLTTLPDCLCHYKDLKVLIAHHNQIEIVSENINNLLSLDELDLSTNKLTSLPDSFTLLSRMYKVNLSQNRLATLPSDMDQMMYLKSLDVCNNELISLPPAIGQLGHLEQLLVRHNRITSIPFFSSGNKLKEFCASFNAITSFPVELCDTLVSLKVLDLRSNKLQEIPEEITNIQGLERLDLGNNDLRSLPYSLGALNHMNSLLVEGNPLRSIRQDIMRRGTVHLMKWLRDHLSESPLQSKVRQSEGGDGQDLVDSINRFGLKSSKTLDLSSKGLSSLDSTIVDMAFDEGVNQLVLTKNVFVTLPGSIERLAENLTELDLSFNRLTSLPEYLGRATRLMYLNLQSNQLTDLPDDLCALEHLRELNICQNRFTALPKCLYSWKKLEILIAADNSLTAIDVDELSDLPMIATLDLRNNSISHVPPELGNVAQLKSVQLEGNLFRHPRPALLAKGTQELMAFLRDRIPH